MEDIFVNRCLECGTVLYSDTDQLCGKYYCSNTDYLSPKDFTKTIIPMDSLEHSEMTVDTESDDDTNARIYE